MNIYCIINDMGNLRLIYGDYLKAVKLATCGVRLVTCNPDDIRFGRVYWEDLPSAL